MSTRSFRAIWAFIALIAGAAAFVDVLVVVPVEERFGTWTWGWFAFLVVAFFLAQASRIELRIGAQAIGFSLMELPLVIGLFHCDPQLLILSRVLGSAAVFAWRRTALQKAAFNCAMFALETAGAVGVWTAVVGGGDPFSPRGWLATGLAVTYTSLLGAVLVRFALTMATGRRPPFLDSFRAQKAGEFAAASFGLVCVYVLSVDGRTAWMLLVVAAVLWVAQRSYDQARQRADSLEQVNRFTGVVGREVELGAVVAQVLRGVCDTFQARHAELSLISDDNVLADWVLTPETDTVDRRPAPLLESLPEALTEPLLLGSRHPGGAELVEQGFRDGLFVPLRAEGGVVGGLAVADPVRDTAVFGRQDLHQLQALANHAAVAIDNALRADLILRQAAEREHAALHDDLTGLPNRRKFCTEVQAALRRARAAVLVIDLDSLRSVNDTLGHQVGDRLLCLSAQRIHDATSEGAVVARLGGDEFAVLLPGADDLAARACASMISTALSNTFDLDGLAMAVDGSIGVAVAERWTDATVAVRHADLALYAAQQSRSGVAVFHPELDRSDSSRLVLLAALRSAVAGNELRVHYQPQVDLASGKVVGVEALARWDHPELGSVPPDEFIPLAEHSGLITPLTMLVLRTALHDAERLQRRAGDLGLAVNISPRSLLDRGFVDEVAHELEQVSLPPSALTLEITETSLMTDPEQSVEALNRLRTLGVRLSVDDLGTGYSSLAYLLRLPVDEVKIDRSFLAPLPDAAAEVMLGAIIDLAQRLGRRVVAEGVEHSEAYEVLRGLGCDLAQGFWMGRPMPLDEMRTYLADRRPPRRSGRGLRQVK